MVTIPRSWSSVSLRHHHFRRFNDGDDVIPFFKLQFLGASAGDDGVDGILPGPNGDLGHDVSDYDLTDLSLELVSRADAHWLSLH